MAPRAPYRCHVRGQLCDLRIGTASAKSYISGPLVRNLNLAVTPHPSPYNITTFPARITTQCLVPITIGDSYREEVLFDVMEEMGICDILLGCAWFSNKKVVFSFDGVEKIEITYNGVVTTLIPEPTNEPDNTPVTSLIETE